MAVRLEDVLRACAVEVTGGSVRGTGFFLAPDRVVTAAHIIAENTSLMVRWERDGRPTVEDPGAEVVTVLAKREHPIPALDVGYPGIAVLRVDGFEGHPCVRIDPELPSPEDNFLVFGYPVERGAVHVTPLRLSYLGVRGTFPIAWLDMTSGVVKAGMSGAAVLNLRTGAVCGVLIASKDQRNPVGGLAVPWSAIGDALSDLVAANLAFHSLDSRWPHAADNQAELASQADASDPDHITTRQDFAHSLKTLRLRSQLTVRMVAQAANIPQSTAADYFSGRHLPQSLQLLRRVLMVFGVDEKELERWYLAFQRVQGRPAERRTKTAASHDEDQTDLLFRIYIPSQRLYATEANRLLSLFRDWLITTRGHGVRQAGYRTASGEMYEFFADVSVVGADLYEEFDNFSSFLTLCSDEPSAAVELLVSTRLGRASSSDLVARFTREVRRLQVDLRHERERRILTIRHSLEEELLDEGVDLRSVPIGEINAMLERLVPNSSATESLAVLAAPWTAQQAAPVTVNINPQIISAMESTIIQNVQGTVNLGPQAKQFLELINRFGGQEMATLESAVHELEDVDARPADRSAAKRRLKKFLGQLAGSVHDVALDLLEKYLESKIGL